MDQRSPQQPGQPDPDDESLPVVSTTVSRGGRSPVTIMAAGFIVAALGWLLLSRDPATPPSPEPDLVQEQQDPGPTPPPDGEASPAPGPTGAAERYRSSPSAATLRDLIQSVGGLDAITLGTAEGSFDLVQFDPLDPGRLLATMRSSYNDAENQAENEVWTLGSSTVDQQLWAPDTPHDFAHFNRDGTLTMWVSTSPIEEYAPRQAIVLDANGTPLATSQPLYASRFTVADNTVFALTGEDDYYSNNEGYRELIADDGQTQTVLAAGLDYGWIDNPQPGIIVAYPADDYATTAVWDSQTLERIEDHPLAGRRYRRLAVSGDSATALGVTFDGGLEQLDLTSGLARHAFGKVDVGAIDQPVTLNHDGTLAVTVERSGLVSLWWVGDNVPLASVAGDAGQTRWIDEEHGALAASAVAPDASRVALRRRATAEVRTAYEVINLDVESWLALAVRLGDT